MLSKLPALLPICSDDVHVQSGEQKTNMINRSSWPSRSASYLLDRHGVEHAIDVSAGSLYEAIAQALRIFRDNDWVEEIGRGQPSISVK